jgi:hypothetical protein
VSSSDPKEVGRLLAEDWTDSLIENSQAEVEAAVEEFGLAAAVIVELNFGDDAVMSLAQTFRETADKIEERLGEFIKRERWMKGSG